jgi:hypothetical protein
MIEKKTVILGMFTCFKGDIHNIFKCLAVLYGEKGMALVKSGELATVCCPGNLDDAVVFHTSAEKEPLEFAVGHGRIIPGFEHVGITYRFKT